MTADDPLSGKMWLQLSRRSSPSRQSAKRADPGALLTELVLTIESRQLNVFTGEVGISEAFVVRKLVTSLT